MAERSGAAVEDNKRTTTTRTTTTRTTTTRYDKVTKKEIEQKKNMKFLNPTVKRKAGQFLPDHGGVFLVFFSFQDSLTRGSLFVEPRVVCLVSYDFASVDGGFLGRSREEEERRRGIGLLTPLCIFSLF
jgi:hypothetical protein